MAERNYPVLEREGGGVERGAGARALGAQSAPGASVVADPSVLAPPRGAGARAARRARPCRAAAPGRRVRPGSARRGARVEPRDRRRRGDRAGTASPPSPGATATSTSRCRPATTKGSACPCTARTSRTCSPRRSTSRTPRQASGPWESARTCRSPASGWCLTRGCPSAATTCSTRRACSPRGRPRRSTPRSSGSTSTHGVGTRRCAFSNRPPARTARSGPSGARGRSLRTAPPFDTECVVDRAAPPALRRRLGAALGARHAGHAKRARRAAPGRRLSGARAGATLRNAPSRPLVKAFLQRGWEGRTSPRQRFPPPDSDLAHLPALHRLRRRAARRRRGRPRVGGHAHRRRASASRR